MDNQNTLFYKIQVCSFNMEELNLFLDTHPECAEAQKLMEKYAELMRELVKEYSQKYGPMSRDNYTGGPWKWIDSPWPWEMTEVR